MGKNRRNGGFTRDVEAAGEKKECFRVERSFIGAGKGEPYQVRRGFGFVTDAVRRESCLSNPEANGGFLPQWWYEGRELTEIELTAWGCTWKTSAQVRAEDLEGRYVPLCYRQDVPRRGNYRLTLELRAEEDAEEVLLYVGRRRLAWRGGIRAEETVEATAECDVSSCNPGDMWVCFSLLCGRGKVYLKSMRLEESNARRVYLMGDSTVTDQTASLPYAPGASYGGWGQMLGVFLPEGYCVSNHAHSGLTTESFRSLGYWATISPLVRQGDLCLIQFGHNDQKRDLLQAEEGYRELLEHYIDELRALGACPILVTPLARNSWYSPVEYNDFLEAYAETVLRLGERRKAPVIDLHGYAMGEIKAVGLEGAKLWFYPSDCAHTNDFGAYKMASFVGRELCAWLGEAGKRQPDWEPHAPLTVLMPPEDCGLTPPADGEDAESAFEEERPQDVITRIECLELVIRKIRFFTVNVHNNLYEDILGHEAYEGTVRCAVQNRIIPPAFVPDGRFYPDRPMSLQEFLAVLMPAYAGRRELQRSDAVPDTVAGYAAEAVSLALGEMLVKNDEDWEELLTRGRAAKLCRAVRI